MPIYRSYLLRRPLAPIPGSSISTTSRTRNFSRTTTAAMVQAGDSLPSVELMENSPGEKVKLSDLLKDKTGLVIGVPAAFST